MHYEVLQPWISSATDARVTDASYAHLQELNKATLDSDRDDLPRLAGEDSTEAPFWKPAQRSSQALQRLAKLHPLRWEPHGPYLGRNQ